MRIDNPQTWPFIFLFSPLSTSSLGSMIPYNLIPRIPFVEQQEDQNLSSLPDEKETIVVLLLNYCQGYVYVNALQGFLDTALPKTTRQPSAVLAKSGKHVRKIKGLEKVQEFEVFSPSEPEISVVDKY